MKPNKQFFIVRIDKPAQTEKRNKLSQSSFGYLGIKNDPENAHNFGGVLIHLVDPDGPAFKAGFNEGDVITAINDDEVTTIEQLIDKVGNYAPGTTVKVTYLSKFAIADVAITLRPMHKDVELGSKPVKIDLVNANALELNLQYGTIVAVGEEGSKQFPQAVVGDTLIFTHHVEYKPRTEGDKNYNDWHLLGWDETLTDEFRVVKQDSEVFGVLKTDTGTIIPHNDWIFCHPSVRKASMQSIGGLWTPDVWQKDMAALVKKSEELQHYVQYYSSQSILQKKTTDKNYKRKEEVIKQINRLNKERTELAKVMRQTKLLECDVIYISETTAAETGINAYDVVLYDQEMMYPLDIGGARFVLLKPQYTYAILSLNTINDMKQYTVKAPLSDRIVIEPHTAEEKTEGGIIIPDTAQEKPNRGVVRYVGPGKVGEPVTLQVNDIVVYGKYAGTQLDIGGEQLVIMRESDILAIVEEKSQA